MHFKNIINDSSFKRNQNQIYLTSQGKKNEVLKNGQGAIFSEINRRACPFIRQMRVCNFKFGTIQNLQKLFIFIGSTVF